MLQQCSSLSFASLSLGNLLLSLTATNHSATSIASELVKEVEITYDRFSFIVTVSEIM